MNTHRSSNPMFVIGTQRSGTTLLCRVLSAHPDLFIQNELNVRQMFGPEKTKEDVIESICRLIQEEHGESLTDILHRSKKTKWGLKDPELTQHFVDLEKFLPDSKFIIIARDGRAVVNSYMENKWGLGTNAYTGAQRWANEIALQMDFKNKHPKNVYFVRYEDLIDDLENEARKLCEFVGLPFHEDILNYSTKPTYYHRTRENVASFEKPKPEMTTKWEKKLSEKQKSIVEYVCGNTLTELGYNLIGKSYKPSNWEIFYFNLHQKIIGEIQIQYRWRLGLLKTFFRRKLQQQ